MFIRGLAQRPSRWGWNNLQPSQGKGWIVNISTQ